MFRTMWSCLWQSLRIADPDRAARQQRRALAVEQLEDRRLFNVAGTDPLLPRSSYRPAIKARVLDVINSQVVLEVQTSRGRAFELSVDPALHDVTFDGDTSLGERSAEPTLDGFSFVAGTGQETSGNGPPNLAGWDGWAHVQLTPLGTGTGADLAVRPVLTVNGTPVESIDLAIPRPPINFGAPGADDIRPIFAGLLFVDHHMRDLTHDRDPGELDVSELSPPSAERDLSTTGPHDAGLPVPDSSADGQLHDAGTDGGDASGLMWTGRSRGDTNARGVIGAGDSVAFGSADMDSVATELMDEVKHPPGLLDDAEFAGLKPTVDLTPLASTAQGVVPTFLAGIRPRAVAVRAEPPAAPALTRMVIGLEPVPAVRSATAHERHEATWPAPRPHSLALAELGKRAESVSESAWRWFQGWFPEKDGPDRPPARGRETEPAAPDDAPADSAFDLVAQVIDAVFAAGQ